jgi:hypothetical protein
MLSTWNSCPPVTASADEPQAGQLRGRGGLTANAWPQSPQLHGRAHAPEPQHCPGRSRALSEYVEIELDGVVHDTGEFPYNQVDAEHTFCTRCVRCFQRRRQDPLRGRKLVHGSPVPVRDGAAAAALSR